jgi:DNA (cytosine-5)-methyltransferase 1
MNHLDLFSGIGGFSLGLERAGFKTVAFCEIEPFCQKILKKHWPDIPIYEDVRDVAKERLESDGINNIGIITGGFPCQDLSIAGRQEGIEAERSGLWSELCRIIGDIRPRYAIVENVTALISGDNGRWFGKVLGDMAEIGFNAQWNCIPASAVGANHRRDRVWILAYPDNSTDCADRWQERETSQVQGKRRKAGYARMLVGAVNDDPNYRSKRIQGFIKKEIQRIEAFSWCKGIRSLEELRERPDIPEPTICRTNDGLRKRLHAIGNAVVPQIPELIGRAIMEAENDLET